MKAITIGLFCGWIGYAVVFLLANIFPEIIPWLFVVLFVLLMAVLMHKTEDEEE